MNLVTVDATRSRVMSGEIDLGERVSSARNLLMTASAEFSLLRPEGLDLGRILRMSQCRAVARFATYPVEHVFGRGELVFVTVFAGVPSCMFHSGFGDVARSLNS